MSSIEGADPATPTLEENADAVDAAQHPEEEPIKASGKEEEEEEDQEEEEIHEELDGDLTTILTGIFDDILDVADEDEAIFEPLLNSQVQSDDQNRETLQEGGENDAGVDANDEASTSSDVKATPAATGGGDTEADEDDTQAGEASGSADGGGNNDAVSAESEPKATRVLSEEELEDLRWRREQYQRIDATRDEKVASYKRLEKYLRAQRNAANAHDAAQAAKPSYDSTNDDPSMFWKKPSTRTDEIFGGKGNEVVDETAQQEVASFLGKWQSEVRNQIPLGPSRLQIDHDFLRGCGGDLGSALLVVRDVMAANERVFQAKSGNVPLSGAYDEIRQSEVAPKYLQATAAVEKRKELVLERQKRLEQQRGGLTAAGDTKKQQSPSMDDDEEEEEDGMETISLDVTVPQKKNKKKKRPTKKMLSAAQRDENENILRRLKASAELGLSHPRFRDKKGQGNQDFNFPAEVLFSEYTAGGEYKRVLRFRNKGSVSRKLRILPPQTQYFSTSALRFPHSAEAAEKDLHTVAPGMACEVTVTFAPDTEGIYRDVVKCITETVDFEVSLRAHRHPPELSLPNHLSCGHCLVDGVKPCEFPFTNRGGPGKFRVLRASQWPLDPDGEERFLWQQMPGGFSPDAKNSGQSNCVLAPPFEVSPAEFELAAGESTTLKAVFHPFVAREEELKLVIVCDNCDVRVITLDGMGSYLSVRAVSVGESRCEMPDESVLDGSELAMPPRTAWGVKPGGDDAAAVPEDDESRETALVTAVIAATLRNERPVSFPKQLVLPPTMRGVPTQVSVTFENPIPLEVPFHWAITPSSSPAVAGSDEGTDGNRAEQSGLEGTLSNITVTPASGVFGPNAKLTFTIQASPSQREDICEQVTLMVDNVPRGCACPEFRFPDSGSSSNNNNNASHTRNNNTEEKQQQERATADLVTLPYHTMSVFGQVVARDVEIPLPRIALHDPVIIGVPIVRRFDIVNRSGVATPFHLSLDAVSASTDQVTVSATPEHGVLAANGEHAVVSVEVTLTATKLGPFAATLVCAAEDVSRPLGVRISGEAIGPEISILTPQVDFGIVRVGSVVTRRLPFTNVSPVPAEWHVSLANIGGSTSSPDGDGSVFKFSPAKGVLAPGEKTTVTVSCSAGNDPEIIRNAICVQIHGSLPRYVRQRADIQQLKCALDRTALKLGNSYVGVPITETVTLRNPTQLPAQFKWRILNPPSKESCSLKFTPRHGVVDPQTEVSVQVTFTPLTAVRFELLCICEVVGMPEPVGFLLTSLARGLILSFVGLNEDEAKEVQRVQAQGQEPDIRSLAVNDKPLTLQFGDGVPIFTKRTQWLCVRNHSGVDTSFSVRARKFPPAPMDPLDFSSTSTAANGLAGTTAKKSTKNGSLGASGTINPDHTSSSPPSNNNRTTRTLKPLHGGGASTSKRRDRKKLRRKLLGQDHELTDRFVSDTGRQLIERNQQLEDGRGLLRAGNGVAFLVPEQTISLPAWTSRLVPVRCFGDVPGSYRDELIAEIDEESGLAPVRVGLRAQLTGCPIALQESSVGLDCTVSPSLLNFGTMPHSSASRRRVISVKNNSPLPAKLSWRAAANADKEPDFFEVKFNFVDEPKKSASSDNSEDAQQQQQQQTSHNWVSIAFNEKTHPPLPFRITPLSADIEPRSLAKFEVEYDPPQAAELSKALLISKVDWKKPPKASTKLSTLAQKILMVQSATRKFLPAVDPAPSIKTPDAEDNVLTIALQAETVVPRLTIVKRGGSLRDPTPQEKGGKVPSVKMRLTSTQLPRRAASDLTVANDSLTDVVFQIVTDSPFAINPKPSATALLHPLAGGGGGSSKVAGVGSSGGSSSGPSSSLSEPTTETRWYKLQPRGNLELQVHYKWSGPSAGQLSALVGSDSALAAAAAAQLPQKEEETGSLWIKYINGEQQEIRLHGIVERPAVEVGLDRGVNPPRFDFGLLQAGVDKDGDGLADTLIADSDANVTILYLGNPTTVPAEWCIVHEPAGAAAETSGLGADADGDGFVDDPSAFSFAARSGSQAGPTVPVASGLVWNYLPEGVHSEQASQMPRGIRVHFRPRGEGRYRSTFRVDVPGGIGTKFTLEGQGTFDELE